ncbi:MAG: ATP-binding protein [Bacteroidota bacterium]
MIWTNTGLIRAKYILDSAKKTLKAGRSAAWLAIPVITLFAVGDITSFGFYDGIPWRILGLSPFILFLILAYTVFRKNTQYVIAFNMLNVLGLGVMMAGLAYEIFIMKTPPLTLKYGVTVGYTAVLFISLIISEGARPYLPYIIILPLGILTGVLSYSPSMELSDWSFLSNVYIVAIVVMIFARTQEKSAYRNFEKQETIYSRESELEVQKEKLEIVNQELQAYNDSVSNDLRNPLRSILLNATLLGDKLGAYFSDDDKQNLLSLRQNALRMNEIIDDMLAYSKVGNRDIRKQELDMRKMFREIFQELVQQEAPKRTIRFYLGEIEGAFGDKIMIEQVIKHLLSNALKFTQREEKAEIEVRGYPDNAQYVYSVKDNGIGLEPSQHDEIFRTTQGLNGEIESYSGGVGLAIVKKIIHRHGGRVWASGNEEDGAIFYFSLNKVPTFSPNKLIVG